jgi:hypothetical protein
MTSLKAVADPMLINARRHETMVVTAIDHKGIVVLGLT